MSWKNSFRSIYYYGAPEPADLDLGWKETALPVVDVQNAYLARPDRALLSADELRRLDALPSPDAGHGHSTHRRPSGTQQEDAGLELTAFAEGGKSLPTCPRISVVCAGICTDQCVSSTVRSLADESYNVVVVDDCCAAGSDELHRKELEITNMIYCHVMSSAELIRMMRL